MGSVLFSGLLVGLGLSGGLSGSRRRGPPTTKSGTLGRCQAVQVTVPLGEVEGEDEAAGNSEGVSVTRGVALGVLPLADGLVGGASDGATSLAALGPGGRPGWGDSGDS